MLPANLVVWSIFITIGTAGEEMPWQLGVLLLAALGAAEWWNAALAARRLHDFGRSAWWLLLYYVAPFALLLTIRNLSNNQPSRVAVALLVVCAPLVGLAELGLRRSSEGANRYGPAPGTSVDAAVFD
jgi:uncharacterized membrane protein YhaH (DUF805 family)